MTNVDRYSPLPHFAHRTRFLIAVQIPLLENYYGRILSSLDAFETLSSAFVRAVPGALSVGLGGRDDGTVKVDTRKLTDGVEGVQRLCKAWLSAKYLQTAMEGWGEELVGTISLASTNLFDIRHPVFPRALDGNQPPGLAAFASPSSFIIT